jgi:hypothetical protein
VLRRAAGERSERLAWLAQRTNLRLRVMAKGAFHIDHERDRAALSATRAARRVEELPPSPQ